MRVRIECVGKRVHERLEVRLGRKSIVIPGPVVTMVQQCAGRLVTALLQHQIDESVPHLILPKLLQIGLVRRPWLLVADRNPIPRSIQVRASLEVSEQEIQPVRPAALV